jgi:hypothetical protein
MIAIIYLSHALMNELYFTLNCSINCINRVGWKQPTPHLTNSTFDHIVKRDCFIPSCKYAIESTEDITITKYLVEPSLL